MPAAGGVITACFRLRRAGRIPRRCWRPRPWVRLRKSRGGDPTCAASPKRRAIRSRFSLRGRYGQRSRVPIGSGGQLACTRNTHGPNGRRAHCATAPDRGKAHEAIHGNFREAVESVRQDAPDRGARDARIDADRGHVRQPRHDGLAERRHAPQLRGRHDAGAVDGRTAFQVAAEFHGAGRGGEFDRQSRSGEAEGRRIPADRAGRRRDQQAARRDSDGPGHRRQVQGVSRVGCGLPEWARRHLRRARTAGQGHRRHAGNAGAAAVDDAAGRAQQADPGARRRGEADLSGAGAAVPCGAHGGAGRARHRAPDCGAGFDPAGAFAGRHAETPRQGRLRDRRRQTGASHQGDAARRTRAGTRCIPRDGRAPQFDRGRGAPGIRCRQQRSAADRARQRRPQPAHPGAGIQPRGNRVVDRR